MAKKNEEEKELIKKLDFDVKQIYKTKMAIIKYMCKPILKKKEELSKELILTFIDDLKAFLFMKEGSFNDDELVQETNKSFDELSEEIKKCSYVEQKLKLTGVVWLQGYVIVRFNPYATNENICKLIPLLHELTLVL